MNVDTVYSCTVHVANLQTCMNVHYHLCNTELYASQQGIGTTAALPATAPKTSQTAFFIP
jgi:hypothetical protein